jgi:hypothetical protein
MQSRCCLLLAAVLAVGCVASLGQSAASQCASELPVLHEGCPVDLSMGRTVSSESDQPDEIVEFVVMHDLVAGNAVILSAGSLLYGKVTASRLDDRATGRPGMVEFRLESVKLANGQAIPLRTIKELLTDANADLSPEKLTNLVNSPYAPFAHFTNGPVTTVPKNTPFTLYVAADVNVGAQPVAAAPNTAIGQSDSLASRILNSHTGAKSLADIAREQRERGKISGGMVSGSQ